MDRRKTAYRLFSIFLGLLVLYTFGFGAIAQDKEVTGEEANTEEVVMVKDSATVLTAETVQSNLDQTWILIAGFLVFFMQAGFAMLEGGFIRHTGVINSLAENFMDACITGVVFFLVGYGVAFGTYNAAEGVGSPFLGQVQLALGGINGTGAGDGASFVAFFFQFAFAGAAGTIATGAMAERTSFVGKLIYSALIVGIIYPIVVFWTWGGGWMHEQGYIDFAGSSIVHMCGGIIALIGAYLVGPRVGRSFGSPPRPSNMALASLGTFILWFGWYGFNVGSTLAASNINQLGLVAVNTTLAACIGAMSGMFFQYARTGKWDLVYILNGALAGLVAITAGCAAVTPMASLLIGAMAGVLVVLSVEFVERLKIDDAVGAFSVHGACGAFGTLMIGVVGSAALGAPSLIDGGTLNTLGIQALGVGAIIVWTGTSSFIMFGALKAAGILRIHDEAAEVGIDIYEHGASLWPDVLPIDAPIAEGAD